MKCATLMKPIAHRSARASPRTALGLQTEGFVRKIRDSRAYIASATHLGRRLGTAQSASILGDLKATRKNQSCHKVVIGN